MKKSRIFKLLLFCWIINITWMVTYLALIIFFVADPQSYIHIFIKMENSLILEKVFLSFFLPSLFLWIYNIRFFYKYDRYSLSIMPLILLNFIYSPYYFYRVQIQKRKLRNEKLSVPVLGNTIQLQDYNDEQDIEKDLKQL